MPCPLHEAWPPTLGLLLSLSQGICRHNARTLAGALNPWILTSPPTWHKDGTASAQRLAFQMPRKGHTGAHRVACGVACTIKGRQQHVHGGQMSTNSGGKVR
jgi:hypothetical protein